MSWSAGSSTPSRASIIARYTALSARTPLAAWERGISGDATSLGRGTPVAVPDPHRFLIDFLPIERRLIRREGISLHSVSYWSDVLRAWVGVPEKMIVRYDPRNLESDPSAGSRRRYYDIPIGICAVLRLPCGKQRLAMKRMHEEGRSHVDESAIFRTIETMRKIADEAVTATKTIRRQQERRLRVIQGGRTDSSTALAANARVSEVEDGEQDNCTAQVRMLPFEDGREQGLIRTCTTPCERCSRRAMSRGSVASARTAGLDTRERTPRCRLSRNC